MFLRYYIHKAKHVFERSQWPLSFNHQTLIRSSMSPSELFKIPYEQSWYITFTGTWGHCDLDFWPPSTKIQKWTFVWYLKTFPRADLKISRSKNVNILCEAKRDLWPLATKIKSVHPWVQVSVCARCGTIPSVRSRNIAVTRKHI